MNPTGRLVLSVFLFVFVFIHEMQRIVNVPGFVKMGHHGEQISSE